MKKIKIWFKNLFIPDEDNNFRAKILSSSFLACLVGIFLFVQTLLSFLALVKPGVLGYSADITPEKIIELTNKERQKFGLSPLQMNSLLNEAAQRKAADMFAFDYWAHISPTGRTPWTFFREVGYSYSVAGENLAKDFSNAEGILAAWMKSPTHKDNILESRFKEIGVAVVDGTLNGIRTTLVVQLFGTPLLAKTAQQESINKPILATTNNLELNNPSLPTASAQAEIPSQINPLGITKIVSAFIFGLLTIALIIDGLIVWKKKIYRISGRNLAHAGFLVIVFLLIMLSQQGVIN